MKARPWFTPLFGAHVLVITMVIMFCTVGFATDTPDDLIRGYVLSGLILVGIIAHAVSAFWLRSLKNGQRLYWWLATTFYGLWITLVVVANVMLRIVRA